MAGIVTYQEWIEMPIIKGEIEEVVNGEIRLFPPNKSPRVWAIHNIGNQIRRKLPDAQFLIAGSYGIIIRKAPLCTRVPDLAVVEESSARVEGDGYLYSPPQLIVEGVSDEDRDRQREEKLLDYASLGVPEFWCVWPDRHEVEVFLLENGAYRLDRVVADGILHVLSLPNVEIAVPAIWPR